MTKYRNDLPQLSSDYFLTDGGLETTLIFHERLNLPEFAAFDLLKSSEGSEALRKYFRSYAVLAKKYRLGVVLDSATWRASSDWGKLLGYSIDVLKGINQQCIQLLEEIRDDFECENTPVVISGCVGPRCEGFNSADLMSIQQAENYHYPQIETFANTSADLVTAMTITYVEEALGIVQAARSLNMPVVISFTVETDGRLPSGQALGEAILKIDEATSNYPAYFMINCAHPTHFETVISGQESWVSRIRGIRANASSLSHAELDEAENLDEGNPVELAAQYDVLRKNMKNLNVFGGCCGTDHRHIEEIARIVKGITE